jgi:hypothetical protein
MSINVSLVRFSLFSFVLEKKGTDFWVLLLYFFTILSSISKTWSMGMQHGHRHAAWTWSHDMQHRHSMQHGHIARACSMGMTDGHGLQHGHGHSMEIQLGPCSMDKQQGHAAWT